MSVFRYRLVGPTLAEIQSLVSSVLSAEPGGIDIDVALGADANLPDLNLVMAEAGYANTGIVDPLAAAPRAVLRAFLPFQHNPASPFVVILASLPAGSLVLRGDVVKTIAFNDPSATGALTLEPSGVPILSSAQVNLSNTASTDESLNPILAATPQVVTFTLTGVSSAGEGFLYVEYVIPD